MKKPKMNNHTNLATFALLSERYARNIAKTSSLSNVSLSLTYIGNMTGVEFLWPTYYGLGSLSHPGWKGSEGSKLV